MINKLGIEGLRGFAEKVEIALALPNGTTGSGLTLLTGPNNSGKSTVIEAIKVRSAFNQTPSFHAGMRNARTDAVLISYEIDGSIDTLQSIRPGSSETHAERASDLAPYVVPSRRQFQPQFGRSGPSTRHQYIQNSASHQALREQVMSGFEGRLFELERSNTAFDALLREVVPDFMDWTIDQNESGLYFVKLRSGGKSHSLAGSGDGIISAFVIIAALFDSQPGDVIAIDEPELSLHPTIQRRLSATITRYAADRQIVVSTHSPYFVDPEALRNGAQVLRTWDRGQTIEVFQLSVSTSTYLDALLSRNANNPHVFGLDAREIFFSNDPILVFEGQEDVVFWPKVVADNPKLAALPTYGWGAGGAANITNVVSVLKALGYRKVCGILDNNRPHDLAALRSSFPEYRFVEIPALDIRSKDAVPAREGVDGLLDKNGIVRAEFSSALAERLKNIEDFMS
jgi:predicted ATPase